jgi:hypothetical protein
MAVNVSSIALIKYDSIPNILSGSRTSGPAVKAIPDGLYAGAGVVIPSSSIGPQAVYNGGYPHAHSIYLSIANGGAGQSGFIKVWADAFIQYSVKAGHEPFCVRAYILTLRCPLNSDVDLGCVVPG